MATSDTPNISLQDNNEKKTLFSQMTLIHWVVISVGMLIFIALFFVNKTPPLDNKKNTDNISNNNPNTKNQPTNTGNSSNSETSWQISDLPETTPEQKKLAELLTLYTKNTNDKEALQKIKEIIAEGEKTGRTDYAALYQEKLFELQPSDSSLKKAAYLAKRAAQMYQSENRTELFEKARQKSIALYEQYMQKNPQDVDAHIDQATLMVESQNPMQGIQVLVKIANDNPKNYRAQLELGIFSLRTNQIPKAIDRLKKVITLQPQNWEGYFYLGMAYKQAGDPNEAKDAFLKANELNTNPVIKSEIEIQLKELS